MTKKTFVMDLARLMISAAWADGELSNDEVNALKDLLFTIEDVSARDWKVLEMYMDSPVTEAETQELLERVVGGIQSHDDRVLVLETLQRLFSVDGTVTPEERDLFQEIEAAVSAAGTEILSKFSKALRSAMRQRATRTKSSCLRETNLEDYVKNTIYYQLREMQSETGVQMDLPEAELRKLCFATGLLAHIANVDSDMSNEEREAMRKIIAQDWNLSAQQADLLVCISCDRTTRGLDYFRLSHGFFDCTTFDERRDFLKTLFKIANASDKTSNDEIEEIRRVAKSLKLSHQDFIDAKLTIPRKDRNGL